MNVEMLHTEACPHAAEPLPQLRRIVAAAGVRGPGPSAAHPPTGRNGSGSLALRRRVDGRDVELGTDQCSDFGLSCRL
jgi:hypothetical protein